MENLYEDILDILLDEENREPITLMDDKRRKITFEQVAVIPQDKKLYCILKPIEKIDGVNDDEAIVFRVDVDEDGDSNLIIEEDEKIAIEVFLKYYDLLKEANEE